MVMESIGVAQAVFSFILSFAFALVVLVAPSIFGFLTTCVVFLQACKSDGQSDFIQGCVGKCLALAHVFFRYDSYG